MKHLLTKVEEYHYEGNHSMWIRFSDGKCCSINFSPILKGPLFGPLMDEAVFSKARLDNETGTIVWPNGADFDPDTLYNWEDNVEELSLRISRP